MNWDASHHEHISVRQLERRAGGLTVVAINQADSPGRIRLFIGCAKERHDRTPELQWRQALPSKPTRNNTN